MGRSRGVRHQERGSLTRRLSRWANRRPVLRAVIIFAVLMGLFYAFVHLPSRGAPFRPYLGILAQATGGVLTLFGHEATVVDTSVSSTAFSMTIVRGCDAIEPMAALIAAVVASPATIWMKIPGILVGTLVFLVINLIRLVSLFLVGIYFPNAFEVVHLDIWQVAFIALIICFWAIWFRWATRATAARPDGTGFEKMRDESERRKEEG